MKSLLKNPITNAMGLVLFTTFYSVLFIITSGSSRFISELFYWQSQLDSTSFSKSWSSFLAAGNHKYIALILIILSIITIFLLLLRRKPYDEYHLSILLQCLAAAVILTLIAIAVLYMFILFDTRGIVEKFTLFITIHWAAVVICDLLYVLITRWK